LLYIKHCINTTHSFQLVLHAGHLKQRPDGIVWNIGYMCVHIHSCCLNHCTSLLRNAPRHVTHFL